MTIGIILAMEKELKKYIEMFKLENVNDNLGIFEGNYNDIKIIICRCGIGKVNAASCTQYLIDKYNPDFIINSGCCGSLTDNLKVLDIVLANYVTYHDFTPIRIMMDAVGDNGIIKVDQKLFDLFKNILDKENISYHIGGIASGDCFVTSSGIRDKIYSNTNCIAVDMESAPISHISKKNNVPFIIIRSISDFADGTIEQEEQAANTSAMIVKILLDNIKRA